MAVIPTQPTQAVIIGLEIHAQVNTATKLFCSCPTQGSDKPNTRTCPVCLGHPGSKPVLNKKAVDAALKLALALRCTIAPHLVFSRKSYFYPDLAKNYQITQYELPLGKEGYLELSSGKKIGITRVHLEEDPASLVHPGTLTESGYVLIDYNRSGNPLVEIVTKPELELDEAREFMNQLVQVLEYLEIFDSGVGIIKADANISIKESGYVRSEVKNITGFKEIERALQYEVHRQHEAVSNHESLAQDTRAWDSAKGITLRLRGKETEEDYGYIIDPDLVPLPLPQNYIHELKAQLPEFGNTKIQRFVQQYRVSHEDAVVLAQEKKLAGLFETLAAHRNPVLVAQWLRRELLRVMHYNELTFNTYHVNERHLAELLEMVEKKEITDAVGKKILEQLMVKPVSPREYVKQHRLAMVSDTKHLEAVCTEAIQENTKAVEDYQRGEEKALNFLVGVVMKKAKGTTNPVIVRESLKKILKA